MLFKARRRRKKINGKEAGEIERSIFCRAFPKSELDC